MMSREITETIQKGHKGSSICDSVVFGSVSPSIHLADLKCLSNIKQKFPNTVSDGTISCEQVATPSEYCDGSAWLKNYYFWSVLYPNILKEIHSQPYPVDGWFNPSSYGPYSQTHSLPQYPLQMVPQSYPPEYGFQEFQYFVVIDFEATCDKDYNPHPQEIIEFPSVLVNSMTGQLEDCFQIYVRPSHNQQLTEFCKDLTGIQQSQVDKGVLLSEALLMHDKWLEDKGVKQSNFAIVTWSNWDCRVMLESECRFKKIRKPSYFNRWINLKIPFGEAFGGARCNLKEAVKQAGLIWEGRAHCGLDDAKNTARLLTYLMARGLKLSITNDISWQSADHPIPSESRRTYSGTPCKWEASPSKTLFPQHADAMNEPYIYCYCGAASMKKDFQKAGQQKDGFFFGCGNCSVKGPGCSFLKWVPAVEPVKAG